jgi:putative tryptophan/tyrosine transport system substrate-binding protein
VTDQLSVGGKEAGVKTMSGKIFFWLLVTVLLTTVSLAQAQQAKKVPLIGFLNPGSSPSTDGRIAAFREGLRELGYVEGKDIVIERRYAEGRVERLSTLARDLVHLKVDILFAVGTPSVEAAKEATQTIPIIISSGDPVGSGHVASLARPGGNITGLTNLTSELAGKRLELLKEVVPRLSRVAVLWHPDSPASALRIKEAEAAAGSLRLQLHSAVVRTPDDFEPAFSAMKKERAGALITLRGPLIVNQSKRILDLAAKNRLPAAYDDRSAVEAGGLMSYGANQADLDRRAATYVDKILKGAKPAELPIEQPSKFELVINLKAAKQIGLTIPPNVLARADKVIK